jgi:transportin-3
VAGLVQTPLLMYAFEALTSEQLFDEAVEAVCGIIHETQEIEDNMEAIELIVPRVVLLKSQLRVAVENDDSDMVRGLSKIFTEAGETYRMLLLRHADQFFPIIEAIGECSAYQDLDVVPITFPFWARFAQLLKSREEELDQRFQRAFETLMAVMIRHLHFSPDSAPLTGQALDDFRSFRHVIGDTLKDCCLVIGTDRCLLAAYEMVNAAIARGQAATWQEIEAPLFSMRSMGATVDVVDEGAIPKIMDLIPLLPAHPRVRYAALLIVARYTEWINNHPTYIPSQLQYVSEGFEDADQEVNAAAGQALKYLCQDCSQVRDTTFFPRLIMLNFSQTALDRISAPTSHICD